MKQRTGEKKIAVTRLTKTIKGKTVIHSLDFHVGKGEKVCLSAPSGAGKSTLIRILAGLDTKFTGTAAVTAQLRAAVFQEPSLFWYKTVAENIRYPLKLNRIPVDRHIEKQYDEWMEVTGLSPFESYYPGELSGGMKQKAALVRAFLIHPDLVLLDEPFKSIDFSASRKIMKFIRARRPDITLVFVTHQPEEIPLLTDRVIRFSAGPLSNDCESKNITETGAGAGAEK